MSSEDAARHMLMQRNADFWLAIAQSSLFWNGTTPASSIKSVSLKDDGASININYIREF